MYLGRPQTEARCRYVYGLPGHPFALFTCNIPTEFPRQTQPFVDDEEDMQGDLLLRAVKKWV